MVQLADGTGTVTKSYAYDAFGNEKNINASDTNPFRYSGEYYDSETGTIYLRARYYEPSIGRFLSEDSYTGNANDPLSLNLYTYCHNNPIIYDDPSGHGLFSTIAVIAAAVKATVSIASSKSKSKHKSSSSNSGSKGSSSSTTNSNDVVLSGANSGIDKIVDSLYRSYNTLKDTTTELKETIQYFFPMGTKATNSVSGRFDNRILTSYSDYVSGISDLYGSLDFDISSHSSIMGYNTGSEALSDNVNMWINSSYRYDLSQEKESSLSNWMKSYYNNQERIWQNEVSMAEIKAKVDLRGHENDPDYVEKLRNKTCRYLFDDEELTRQALEVVMGMYGGVSSSEGKALTKELKSILDDAAKGSSKAVVKSVDNVLEGTTSGRVTKGRATQYGKTGGYNQALDDFNSMGLSDVKDIPGGKVGKLPDGRTVNVRAKSSDGRPTLEIYDGKNSTKIRYDD